MTPDITIHEPSCRGCELCVEVCPTEVFEMDREKGVCRVKVPEDCIACLSCSYICPSGAIGHHDFHLVKNFYRDEDYCSRMGKFL